MRSISALLLSLMLIIRPDLLFSDIIVLARSSLSFGLDGLEMLNRFNPLI